MAILFRVVLVHVALAQAGFAQLTETAEPKGPHNQNEKRTVQQLENENALLREELASLQQRAVEEQVKTTWLDAMRYQIERDATALTNTKAREAARNNQIRSLNNELLLLKEREDHLRNETGGISSAAAIDRMAERLAEAQIENRLRLLEAQAMVEVLEQNSKNLVQEAQKRTKFAVQQAEFLVKQRQVEIVNIEHRARKHKDALGQVGVAKLELEKAKLFLQQAQHETEAGFTNEIDRQIIDAAMELAVSKLLEQFLKEEANRVNSILVAGSDFGQIKSEVEALRKELVDLKLKAFESQKEIETLQAISESARMEREILFPLQIRQKILLESVGNGHPSFKIAKMEIELVKQQVEQLRRAERAESAKIAEPSKRE